MLKVQSYHAILNSIDYREKSYYSEKKERYRESQKHAFQHSHLIIFKAHFNYIINFFFK